MAGVVQAQVKTTKSGHTFTQVSEEELARFGVSDVKKFGEAWKDESGVVWGGMAKSERDANASTYMN